MGNTITSLDTCPNSPAPSVPPAPGTRGRPRAGGMSSRYENAQTTENSRALWVGADAKSPNNLNDAYTRFRLRNRSRYECDNNSSYSGLISTRAADTVGHG